MARGRGGLILVGSEAALGGTGRLAIYTATKGCMLNFGESLWKELKPRGVDVLNLLIGATAWLGGGLWVPGSSLAAQAGLADAPGAARVYVHAVVGPSLRADLLDAFLDAAPRMVDFLHAHTAVRFALQRGFADWHPQATGFSREGRLLVPVNFDGRALGEHLALLRPPLAEFNAPGGMMIGLADMAHAAGWTRSLRSFKHMARLGAAYVLDRLRHPRGLRLTMGNALAARLLRSALDAGVTLWRRSPMQRLLIDGSGAVTGIAVERQGRALHIHARRGVVLASGGFSANPQMRARYLPYPEHHVSLVPEGNTGDGLQQALGAGAGFDGDNHSNAGWVVVSVLREADGRLRKFPHLFLDRGKPGCIAVNARGQRFGNEASTNLVQPMHRSGSVPAHLICDNAFIHRYGLGLVRPGGFGLRRLSRAGYVISAATLAALAEGIGAPAAALQATVQRFNAMAAAGADEDFGRGSSAADHVMGDASHRPNPNLGPITQGPFHAVQIFPGDSTTTVGLRVDADARVLDAAGRPIPGLQAIGLDMNSLWRGRAPGNGANNRLGLSFGFIAAQALARGR